MTAGSSIHIVLEKFRTDAAFANNIIHYRMIEGKQAIYAEFPFDASSFYY